VVTITATKAADSNYNSASDTYQLTITDDEKPTLTLVSIKSNNAKNPTSYAKELDAITLKFTASEPLNMATITSTITGRVAIINDLSDGDDKTFAATVVMQSADTEGNIGFSIANFADLSGNVGDSITTTTDSTAITYVCGTV